MSEYSIPGVSTSADELIDPSPDEWFSYPDALEFVIRHFRLVRRAFNKLHAELISGAVHSLRAIERQGDKFVRLSPDAWSEGGDLKVELTTTWRGSREVLGDTWRDDDLTITWQKFEMLNPDLILLNRQDVEQLCGLPERAAVEAPVAPQSEPASRSEPEPTVATSEPETATAISETPETPPLKTTRQPGRPSGSLGEGTRRVFKHFDPIVERDGKFLNLNRAVKEALNWAKGKKFTIDRRTLERNIRDYRPNWFEPPETGKNR
jgi:hypothetical protein